MPLTPILLAQSDARLIELAGAGHERAFEVLVRRYRPQLLRHCRRILPADAAEDALQQGLLGAWLALQNGGEVREARAWLHRVVHNAALRAIAPAAGHAELPGAELRADAPEDELIRRQDLRDTLSALASLPELQREALVQTTVEGQSYESVAQMLGLSQSSLRGLIYRARATMRGAVTAITPMPLLGWVAGRARPRGSAAAVQAGSASAPAAVGGLLVKGGAVVLAVGAAAGGIGVAHLVSAAGKRPPMAHARRARERLARGATETSPGERSDASEPMLRDLVSAASRPVGQHRAPRAVRVRQRVTRSSSQGSSHGDGSGNFGAQQSGGSSGGSGPSASSAASGADRSSSNSGSGSGPGSGSGSGSSDRSGSDGGSQTSTLQATTADGSGGSDSGSGGQTTSTGATSSDGGGGGTSGGQSSTDTSSTSSSGSGS